MNSFMDYFDKNIYKITEINDANQCKLALISSDGSRFGINNKNKIHLIKNAELERVIS